MAGFWFLYGRLRTQGLPPWCAARLAFQYRNRWTRQMYDAAIFKPREMSR